MKNNADLGGSASILQPKFCPNLISQSTFCPNPSLIPIFSMWFPVPVGQISFSQPKEIGKSQFPFYLFRSLFLSIVWNVPFFLCLCLCLCHTCVKWELEWNRNKHKHKAVNHDRLCCAYAWYCAYVCLYAYVSASLLAFRLITFMLMLVLMG